MKINRIPTKIQPMNLIHKASSGAELWLGDYYGATNLNLLKQKGIKSVFTSAAMLGIAYPKQMQINHKTINAFDLPSYRMTPHFEQAYQFISSSLQRGNILVHCAAGISRSTTFVIVYLMRTEGMTVRQAIDYVRSKRSIICPNQGFQKELIRYQIFVSKLPKLSEKGQKVEKVTPAQQLQPKQLILEIPKEQNGENKSKSAFKIHSSLGAGQVMANKTFSINSNNSYNCPGLLRGKSVKEGKKENNNLPSSLLKQQYHLSNKNKANKQMKSEKMQIGKIPQQFLTFKLENPKIVTIKK